MQCWHLIAELILVIHEFRKCMSIFHTIFNFSFPKLHIFTQECIKPLIKPIKYEKLRRDIEVLVSVFLGFLYCLLAPSDWRWENWRWMLIKILYIRRQCCNRMCVWAVVLMFSRWKKSNLRPVAFWKATRTWKWRIMSGIVAELSPQKEESDP